MTNEKLVPIKYTSRDFNSIKNDLLNYAKRYYPDSYKDFNEAAFGSLMLDSVSYIGDMLSFYLDYQANESFLSTALEFDNIVKLGRQQGYKYSQNYTSHGTQTFYILVPSDSNGTSPDTSYLPILKAGSQLSSKDGNNFILNEDVNFADPTNEVTVATTDSVTGVPTAYAVKAKGKIISGNLQRESVMLGDFKKFLKITLSDMNIAEILSVFDAQGNQYFEVDSLSQDIIYKAISNNDSSTNTTAPYILKPISVPRRFVVEQEKNITSLQFGFGSETEVTTATMLEPSEVALKLHGKSYVTDQSFDPTDLLSTDKLGISPANTTLVITHRTVDSTNVNAPIDSINNVVSSIFVFPIGIINLNSNSVSFVRNSLETTNEEIIMGSVSTPTSDELKQRILATNYTQNRAVTKQDYINLVYRMHPKFGAVKRCNILQDDDAFRRNLNLYVIGENRSRKLTECNSTIKENLKNWLNKHKMINDTIDIIDAKIVNIGINFEIVADSDTNKYHILDKAVRALQEYYNKPFDIGESFSISNVYKVLNSVAGVTDTVFVTLENKVGGLYSDVSWNINTNTSPDGRFMTVDETKILEIKYAADIKGSVK